MAGVRLAANPPTQTRQKPCGQTDSCAGGILLLLVQGGKMGWKWGIQRNPIFTPDKNAIPANTEGGGGGGEYAKPPIEVNGKAKATTPSPHNEGWGSAHHYSQASKHLSNINMPGHTVQRHKSTA